MKKLKKKGVPPKYLFSVVDGQDIMNRNKLPEMKEFFKWVVEHEFPAANPKVAYVLLGQVAVLLRISYIGCTGLGCSTGVVGIQSKYQDLTKDASDVTYENFITFLCNR